MTRRPVFVLHEHDAPRRHYDLRLEEDGVLRSWAVPKGLPDDARHDRLAVAVDDHDLGHASYEDETKRIADDGWWELEDRDDRRFVFVLHGRDGAGAVRPDRHRGRLAAAPHPRPARPSGVVLPFLKFPVKSGVGRGEPGNGPLVTSPTKTRRLLAAATAVTATLFGGALLVSAGAPGFATGGGPGSGRSARASTPARSTSRVTSTP